MENRKKVAIANIIIDLFGFVMLVFVIMTNKMATGEINERKLYISIIILVLYVIVANLLTPKFIIPFFEGNKEEEKSKKVVEEQLSNDYTEVVPINAIHYYPFIVHHLTKIAKFYAILDEENMIRIYVKMNNELEKSYFEKIPKGKFTMYYKLKNINIE